MTRHEREAVEELCKALRELIEKGRQFRSLDIACAKAQAALERWERLL